MRRIMGKKNKERGVGVLFIMPSMIGQVIFFMIPMIFIFYYAMVDNPISSNFVGLKNFIDIWSNDIFIKAMTNTVSFMAISITAMIVLSLTLAMLLNMPLYLRNILRTLFMIPLIVPSASVLMVWNLFFNYNGSLNSIVTSLGYSPVDWMNSSYSRMLVIFFFIWKNIGYCMVLFIAALQNVPIELYEAASIDGASHWHKFRHITLINILPTVFFVFIISISNSFRIFREIFLISGEYPYEDIYMIQHYINNLFNVMDYQKLAVSAIYLMMFIGLLVVSWYFVDKKIDM